MLRPLHLPSHSMLNHPMLISVTVSVRGLRAQQMSRKIANKVKDK